MRLTELTREHGVKIPPPLFGCSVEEISLAVGELVGHSHVKSAARMNSAVVIFLDSIEAADVVQMNGISVGERFLPAYALASREVKVTVSNVPPFVKGEAIIKELSKHGKVVSPVQRVSSGFRSPLLQHVVSHRRHVFLIPSNRSRVVDLSFKLTVGDFDYVIFAKTNDFKCYSCGREGHLSRACPGEHGSNRDQNRRRAEGDRGDKQDGQEGTSGAQEARVEVAGVALEARVEETGVAQEVRGEETGVAQEGGVEETVVALGVRGEETGVAQEGGVEETGVALGVRGEETGVALGVRVEETGVAQEGGVEETGVAQEVRGEATSGLQEVRESTGGQVESGSEVDMEEDEAQLRVPQLKRKGDTGGVSQAKKVATTASIEAAECEPGLEKDSESSLEKGAAAESELSEHEAGSCKDSESYSVEEIQEYLRISKNVRGAKVEDYFADKEKLSSSARAHMRSKDRGGLTKQEGFRLRKIVQTIRTAMSETGAHVLTPAVSRAAGGRSQDGHPGRHDSRLSGMRRPSEDSGLSSMLRPSEDSGLSGMLRPSEDSGLSSMLRPSEDSTGGAGGS